MSELKVNFQDNRCYFNGLNVDIDKGVRYCKFSITLFGLIPYVFKLLKIVERIPCKNSQVVHVKRKDLRAWAGSHQGSFSNQAELDVLLKGKEFEKIINQICKQYFATHPKPTRATTSMSEHIFQPASVENADLYYEGDIPVLELKADDSYKCGYAHGSILAPYLSSMFQGLSIASVLPKAYSSTSKAEMDALMARIPAHYLEELKGITAGYQNWSSNQAAECFNLSLYHLMQLHLIPDIFHYSLESSPITSGLACTALMENDGTKGMVLARNLDWQSYNIFGKTTLLIVRKYSNGSLNTVSVETPGMVGVLTGMNQAGVSLAMNVCQGSKLASEGIPAAFYNRMCLDNCHAVDEVAKKIQEIHPLGPYHLCAIDSKDAQAFHFYQGKNDQHIIRKKHSNSPLSVTNCRYLSDNKCEDHMFYSKERANVIQNAFKDSSKSIKKWMDYCLSTTPVNNELTIQKVMMIPQSKKIKLSFANSKAGSLPLQKVSLSRFF